MVVARRQVVLILASAILVGCTATSDYMMEAHAPDALKPTAEAATVVFVRPSSYARGMRSTILDGHGRFLGDSLPESYFAVKVPPGEHLFIAWAENTAALRATLAPGKTYYIEVAPKLGAFSARMQLLAVTPRSENWKEVRQWVAESKQLLVNEAGGQAYLRERQEDVQERIKRAGEILHEYDPRELEERTLRPEDGT
jgi:hypothetical protein